MLLLSSMLLACPVKGCDFYAFHKKDLEGHMAWHGAKSPWRPTAKQNGETMSIASFNALYPNVASQLQNFGTVKNEGYKYKQYGQLVWRGKIEDGE